jgi:hypothetical protein
LLNARGYSLLIMPVQLSKLEVMNNALRLVGSYHLESTDTTSATYQIADRAFDEANHDIFSSNIFAYNTKHVHLTGSEISGTTPANLKPNTYWKYSFSVPIDFNFFLGVTDKDGYLITDYWLGFYPYSASTDVDKPTLYCNYSELYLDYTFLPDLDNIAPGTHGNDIRRMPPFLVRLITLHMAQNMAIELSGSENRHEILFKQYTLALRRARMLEGRSSPAQRYITDGTSSFIQAHQNYGSIQ